MAAVDVETCASPGGGSPSSPAWSSDALEQVPAALLLWYDSHRRKLPWRGDAPPFSGSTRQATEDRMRGKEAGGKSSAGTGQAKLSSFFKSSKPISAPSKAPAGPPAPPAPQQAASEVAIPVTPYGVWISEVMLQQTRVEAVIPFWLKWMQRFPDVAALATAPAEDVLAAWAGLGFYRRARSLHKGAQFIMSQCAGRVPTTVKELLQVPSIGPYTAGAVASIALGQQEAVVDGNVIRVWCRMHRMALDPKVPATAKACWPLSRSIVPAHRPGDFNQALMELGATICTPKAPACDACPVAPWCAARAESVAKQEPGVVLKYPAAASKKPQKQVAGCMTPVLGVDGQGRLGTLLRRRQSKGGLLAGAFEPPGALQLLSAAASGAAGRGASDPPPTPLPSHEEILQEALPEAPMLDWGDEHTITHVFSGVTHTLRVRGAWAGALPAGTCLADTPSPPTAQGQAGPYAWYAFAALPQLGLTTWACKILATGLARAHAPSSARDALSSPHVQPALALLAARGKAKAAKRRGPEPGSGAGPAKMARK